MEGYRLNNEEALRYSNSTILINKRKKSTVIKK